MKVISPRWLYFWLFAWLAGHGRFTSLFLEDQGLNEIQIGILLSMNAIISIVSAPLICNYADHIVNSGRKDGYELVVALCSIVVSFAFCLQYFSNIHTFDDATSKFMFFVTLRVLYSIFLAPIYAIVDGMAVRYLVDAGLDKAAFGNERLFGAVSWAIVNFAMGICIDKYGTQVMYLFTGGFLVSLLYCIRQFGASRMTLPHHPMHATAHSDDVEDNQEAGDIEIPKTVVSRSNDDEIALEDDVFYEDTEPDYGLPDSITNAEDDTPLLNKTSTSVAIRPTTKGSKLAVSRAADASLESRDEQLEDDLPELILPSNSRSGDSNNSSSTGAIDERDGARPSEVLVMIRLMSDSATSVAFVMLFAVLSSMTSIVENLVFILFRDTLGSSNFICGVSVVVTVVFEIPLFAYSKHMLDRFGQNCLMVIACICYIVRVVGYTYAPSGFWILFVEPLHGVTYACSKVASVHFVADIAPDGMQATAQGIVSSVAAVGKLLGTSLGGYVEETYGSDVLYRGAAVLLSIVLSAFVAALYTNRRSRSII